jgi:beta-glucosidase
VVGITSQLEGEELRVNQPGFKGGDRTGLDLPQEEEDLLQAMKKTGKPLVVVLMNGSALAVNWAAKNANAILEAWYPGEEGGTAVAETLSGLNNPAGRLPVTFYSGIEQLPLFEDYSMKNRTYRYFSGDPLYPFGYGLSYAHYAYANLKLSKTSLAAGDPLAVDLDLTNQSQRAGDEVVELYLNFPPTAGAPIRALRGFERVHLPAGTTRHVHLDLSSRDLSMVNESGDRVIVPGDYGLTIGGGQPGTGAPSLHATFTIQGQQTLPE